MSRKKTFRLGDRVEVTSGRDRGALGTITGLTGSALVVRIDPQPMKAGRTLSLLASSVTKAPAAAGSTGR